MSTVGKAYVQIVPSSNGIKSEMEKLLGDPSDSAGKNAGRKAGNSLMSSLKSVVKAAAIGKILKDAFTAGSDLEQNLGGTEAVFGTFATNVQKTAADAYKNMGLSASDYMATANKMGSLFQGSGLEQSRAFDLTAQAMQRAADVASVMGIDTNAAMESIAGAAKGNFTMMDNLGVAMNATTIAAYALEKGINFDWNTASNAEKAEIAMQMFFDRTSQYAGNFEREVNDTIAGSLSALQSSWQNLLGAITTGNNLDGALNGLTKSALSFAKNALGMGKNIAAALGKGMLNGIPYVMQQATTVLSGFSGKLTEALPEFINKGGQFLLSVVQGFTANLPALATAAVTAINSLQDGFASSLPAILSNGADILLSLVSGIINNLPTLLSAGTQIIINFVGAIIRNLPQIMQQGIEIVGKLAAGIITAIPKLFTAVSQIFQNVAQKFREANWAQIGSDLMEGIKNGMLSAVSRVVEAARNAVRSAMNAAKAEGEIGSPSKAMAREVGRWLPAGMAVGIEKYTPLAEESMRASVNSAIMSARADLQNLSGTAHTLTANDLQAAMSGVQMQAPVVRIIGDTSKIFKVVNDTNKIRTRATNYNALAMG